MKTTPPNTVGKVGDVPIFQIELADAIQYAIDFFDRAGGVYTGFIYIGHESLTDVRSPSYLNALQTRGVATLSDLTRPLDDRQIHMGLTWAKQEDLAKHITQMAAFYNRERFSEVLFFVSPNLELSLEPNQKKEQEA